jgi:2-iminobutanoate/2-iminopropanoate deaminase
VRRRLGLIFCLASCAAPAKPAHTCIKHVDHRDSGYSNAVRVGDTVYVAGQLPFGVDGAVSDDVEAQIRQDWKNLETVMTAAGGSLHDVVATTTYITAREYGEAVNKVRSELFPTNPPTSSKIVVVALACATCKVEINAIAVLPPADRSCD